MMMRYVSRAKYTNDTQTTNTSLTTKPPTKLAKPTKPPTPYPWYILILITQISTALVTNKIHVFLDYFTRGKLRRKLNK